MPDSQTFVLYDAAWNIITIQAFDARAGQEVKVTKFANIEAAQMAVDLINPHILEMCGGVVIRELVEA